VNTVEIPAARPFTIRQASLKLNVPTHTLRFWEKMFHDFLAPGRTPGGQRRYALEELAVLIRIKQMRAQALGLPDIRRRLEQEKAERVTGDRDKVNILVQRISEMVKWEVMNFLKEDGQDSWAERF
jgi:DNA-binding transcriptional MerR regulator